MKHIKYLISFCLGAFLVSTIILYTKIPTKPRKRIKKSLRAPKLPVLLIHSDKNFADMTENMLLSMKGFPLDRWLVAFDDEQYQRCLDFPEKIRCLSLKNETLDPTMPRGAQRFVHSNSLLSTLKAGREVLWVDTDVVWFQNPIHTFEQRPDIHFFYTSDALQDGGSDQTGLLNCGVMYLRPTPWVISIIENWTKRIIAHPKKWDQALLRETMAEFKPPPGLTLGLPVTKWSNGHIYFVQHVVTDPIMVHNTFQYGGSIGKDWRFMESGLWSLPYPYDDKPREYMTYHPKYPEIGQVKPIPHKNAKEWVIKTHMTYMEPQLRQFEAALNLARLKNRVLILPQFKCLYDRVWFPHPGRFPGSAAFPLPYICPTDHILKIWEPNIERDKIRPYGFQPKKGDVEIVTVDQLKTKPTEIFRKRWTHPWCCTEDGIIEYNIQNF